MVCYSPQERCEAIAEELRIAEDRVDRVGDLARELGQHRISVALVPVRHHIRDARLHATDLAGELPDYDGDAEGLAA